jgi:hypothetical protein
VTPRSITPPARHAKARRQPLDPARTCAEPRFLPRAQLGARLQDEVVRGGEFGDERFGERAAARPEFENRLARLQELGHLPRERAGVECAQLRRRGEVPGRAELGRAARVVAQARLVERKLHVAREVDPVAARRELLADAFHQSAARGERLRLRLGQHAGNLT